MEISYDAIVIFSHESCVKAVKKSNLQSETPSIVTHTRDNIKMDLRVIALGDMDWINMT
jgi:hypothetical protein